jgi:hypothetical protein
VVANAELVRDRGSGAIIPSRRRRVCWVAAHGEIAEQMFQPGDVSPLAS